jgi:class 3 adenylate cyclase
VKANARADDQARFDQPYPLLRSFVRFILPGLGLLLVISAVLTMYGARQLAEGVYLEQATRRAQVIDRAMTEAVPDAWHRLKSGEAPRPLYAESDGQKLLAELTREVRELDLATLKIYAKGGVIQFDTDNDRIGTVDRSMAYVAAAERGESSVVYRVAPGGSVLYELYVLVDVPGAAPVVFELYEPVDHLNALLWRAGTAAAGVPSLILLGLMLAMTRIVVLAQRNITGRAALVAELRTRLERLVSGAASQAVHGAVGTGGEIPSVRARCTLLYADVRDFTSFSETNEPEQVIGFLNRLVTIIVEEIDRAGGDVDKLIGDAVLARFQGDGAEACAISAACKALRRVEQAAFPRGIGVGIFTGEVISGTVGSADRMDFTVIGDSVNIAARLCSIAARGELVADTDTVRAAKGSGFGAEELIAVKGRRERLTVRRWRPDGAMT